MMVQASKSSQGAGANEKPRLSSIMKGSGDLLDGQAGATAPSPPVSRSLKFTANSNFMLGFNSISSSTVAGASNALGSKHFAKKLVIRELKIKPSLPADFEQKSWAKLRDAIRAIFAHEPIVGSSLEELYKACEAMCQHKYAENLYERVSQEIAQHTWKLHADLLPFEAATLPELFLGKLTTAWDQYTEGLLLIRSIFMYLDRTYVLPSGLTPLWDLGLRQFALNVMTPKESPQRGRTVSSFLDLMRRFRDASLSQSDDSTSTSTLDARKLVQLTAKLMDALEMYFVHLEPKLLECSRQYYRNASSQQRLLAGDTLPATSSGVQDQHECGPTRYLHWIQSVLKVENELAQHLQPRTLRPLLDVVQSVIVADHVPYILSGLPHWLSAPCEAELRLVYTRFDAVQKVSSDLRSHIAQWVQNRGSDIVHQRPSSLASRLSSIRANAIVSFGSNKTPMIDELLLFKIHIEGILERCFRNDEAIVLAVKDSFSKFMNMVKNKPAEFMAKYVDEILRSHRTVNENDVENTMDHVLQLFRHIQGKDTFIAFYKTHLSKRLLAGKTTSVDAEKSMLARLRNECGKEFTENLEKMFSDVDVSKSLTTSFNESKIHSQMKARFDLNVTVCQKSVWPSTMSSSILKRGPGDRSQAANAPKRWSPMHGESESLHLPVELANALDKFKEFYTHQHTGRKLEWQHDMGSMIIKTIYNKELILTVPQALVLLAFNGPSDQPPKVLGLAELQEVTNIEIVELKRTLQSLALGKVRVIRRTSASLNAGVEIMDNDQFVAVDKLQHPKFRIRISPIIPKETQDADDAKTHEKVSEDRSWTVDAAIVRILKTRKQLAHQALFAEVLEQCKFPIEPSEFKKRIESLMEREFLERDPSQNNVYLYVA